MNLKNLINIFYKDTKIYIIYKDKDAFPKTKILFQRQRRAKDVPKTEALREDVKDVNSKDKDAKDKLDVFLMKKRRKLMRRIKIRRGGKRL